MLRIVIPAYNEEENIQRCIEAIARNLNGRDYVINVVDDGSRDNTPKILKRLSSRFPLKVITHQTNLGVSAVLKSGIGQVVKDGEDTDVLVIVEGDGTSDSSLLTLMVGKVEEGYDLVIASRYKKGGGYRRFPIKRLFFSLSANFIFRVLFPYRGVSDYTIFYRAYRLKILRKVLDKYKDDFLTSQHFVGNAEILLKVMPYVGRVYEVPYLYDYGLKKGKSSLVVRKNLWEYLKFITITLRQKLKL